MIDRYERGVTNPSLTKVAKLAEALDVEPAELLTGQENGVTSHLVFWQQSIDNCQYLV